MAISVGTTGADSAILLLGSALKIKAFVLLYAGLLLAAISLVQVQNTLPKGDVLTEGVAGATKQRIVETYGKLPLSFEANQGQTDRRVKFISRGPGYTLFLNSTEAVLSLSSPQSSQRAQRMTPNFLSASSAPSAVNDPNPQSTVLRMKLVGANPHPEVVGLEELPGKSNYFIGNDPAKWRTNVPTYARVQYKDVYPGVDLVYYGNQRQLEYDLIVAPGADPGAITLSFEGVERLRIDAQGDLVLDTSGGEIRQHKPLVYQEVDGVQREISGAYVLNGGRQVGFEVAAYDASKPLIIDPVLSYSTYLGGSRSDAGFGIAVDASGNAYVTGFTGSTDFPTASPLQPAFGGGPSFGDAFVTKVSASGNALVYSTYLGGSDDEFGEHIAVDASGNAYVTGLTDSTNFPTASPFQAAFGGNRDAFVTKLNAAGNTLVYSTYLGGSADDDSRGIAVDAAGNAYLAGFTGSPNFPTASPIQPANAGGTDAFVTKLNAAGNALVYSTYLGGTESGRGIAVDASGNAYVTGQTNSTNFPTVNPFQATKAGSSDAFVAKITVALPDIIPRIANSGTPESGGFFMIFNAVNVTSEPATVTVEFFDSQGAPMSMPILGGEFVGFTATLQPGGYTAVQTVPNGSGARIGYALITSTPNDSVAVNATFVQLVPGRPPFMAGIPATNTLHSTAYMPYVSDGGFTPSLALVSQLAQTVTLTARSGVEGAFRCSTTLSFVDGEHRAFLLRDVLPCTATGEGSLEILGSSSTPELSGIGFLANDEGAFVTQPIWSSTGAGGIVPQIANTGTPESGGFFTIFSAVNVTSGPATVTVEFFDSQGAPMSMPILGGEFVGFTATLQPGGYTAVQTVPNGSGARIGYALITSTPNDSVAVNATFVQLVPGRPPFMAGIPATNTLHSTAYMPYVSDGGFTPSLALVSQLAQTVTLTARSGVEGAFRCSTTLSFVDGEHRAFLLRDVLPCTATGKGSLEILGSSSTPELSGIGFLANDEGAFVTQPIWSR